MIAVLSDLLFNHVKNKENRQLIGCQLQTKIKSKQAVTGLVQTLRIRDKNFPLAFTSVAYKLMYSPADSSVNFILNPNEIF